MQRKIIIILLFLAVFSVNIFSKENEYKYVELKFTNCYLLPVENEYLLIDTGYDYEWELFTKELKKVNIELSQIRFLFITHAHDDHVGLVNQLIEHNPEIKIICSEKTKEFLSTGKHNNIAGAGYINKRVGFILRTKGKLQINWTHTFPKFHIRETDLVFANDISLKELGINIEGKILLTPGHTLDCSSLILDNGDCFCGDASANFLKFLGTKYCVVSINDLNEYYLSWDKIINNNAKVIYPAHGKSFSVEKLKKNLRKNKQENIDIW